MSKSPFSFTPEPSPVSSQQKPQTFDFSTLLAQKAIEKLEQECEIAQQEAWAKQKIEESIKQAALESSLNKYLEKLESTSVINGDYWDDLKESINVIKNNSVNVELINRFANLAAKLQNTGMIIKEFYDSIFSLGNYFLNHFMSVLPTIGNAKLAEEIDRNIKEHLKKKLDREVLQGEDLDGFMTSFQELSDQSENDNFIKFLLIEFTKEENFDLLSEFYKNDIFTLYTKFIQDLPPTKAFEKLKLKDFLDFHKLNSILNLDKDLEFLKSLNIDKNKEIEQGKWEEIFSFIQKSPKKLGFLESVLWNGKINSFLQKNSSFFDLFKGEIIPVEMQFNIGKLYKTGDINKYQYKNFLKILKETLTTAGKAKELSELLDASLDLKSFDKAKTIATIDPVIYDLFDKSISYPAALESTLIEYAVGSRAYTDSILTKIAGCLQEIIEVYPIAKTILKTAQLEGFIGIFNSPADPNDSRVKGSYKPTPKDVIIGQSCDTIPIINTAGTIIHELTHKHMFQNVNQTGVPFKKDNPEAQKFFETTIDRLKTENDALYQCYNLYAESKHMLESIAHFFQKNSKYLYTSKLDQIIASSNKLLDSDNEDENDDKTDSIYKSGIYQAAVEKYLLPIMHGFDIIFEKLNSIFSGKAKVTGTVLDYLDGDYNVSLLEAMEFITLKLDPRTTHTITDYLGADWQEADVID
ncbi:hypothetical protein MPCS_00030 [Candidatus Megaera polyxenophila]|nr:hypothetical protein MPCS_00030 [Candidatus Megaera polyxenophila]